MAAEAVTAVAATMAVVVATMAVEATTAVEDIIMAVGVITAVVVTTAAVVTTVEDGGLVLVSLVSLLGAIITVGAHNNATVLDAQEYVINPHAKVAC